MPPFNNQIKKSVRTIILVRVTNVSIDVGDEQTKASAGPHVGSKPIRSFGLKGRNGWKQKSIGSFVL